MAKLIQVFNLTTLAGTLPSAPKVFSLAVQRNMVVSLIRIRVPPGPRGELAFQMTSGGVPVIPYGGGFVFPDNETIEWPLDDAMDSGAWQLTAYNTGNFAHTVYVQFLLDQLDNQGVASLLPSFAGATVEVTAPQTSDMTGAFPLASSLPAPSRAPAPQVQIAPPAPAPVPLPPAPAAPPPTLITPPTIGPQPAPAPTPTPTPAPAQPRPFSDLTLV